MGIGIRYASDLASVVLAFVTSTGIDSTLPPPIRRIGGEKLFTYWLVLVTNLRSPDTRSGRGE